MKNELIAFKGIKEGIFISITGKDFSAIKAELDTKMKNALKFYQGTKILGIKSDELSPEDLKELRLILKYKYELIVADEDLLENTKDTNNVDTTNNNDNTFQGIDCGMTKFVNGTLRSGQVVEYEGNIVIIGDVNPGALIQAKGNIIVLGTLRGVAHAGADGNIDSVVAAYNLQPMQLRIGDIIARPPDDGEGSFKVPEVAKIKDGEVIIEPYLPNK